MAPLTNGPYAPEPGSMPWLGTNFWSSAGGPRMWARYDGEVVAEELAVLASLGLNVTRSFCYWPDWSPAPETLDEDVAEHFGEFLDLHSRAGLSTVPTFIVGHMSGQNWDPAWRDGRDLYRDVWLVAQQAWFVAEVAQRFHRHPAICGWLLSNEMPLYGGSADQEAVTAWARLLVHALRSSGAAQPVGTGDGAWGMEVTGKDNGFSLRRLARLVDFVGPHTYPSDDDPVRQNLSAAFSCELAGTFGKPVVLEEFGLSSDMASGPYAAAYYRQVLYSSLLAGARGWLAWNNCDFDNLASQDPYRHHPFEMHFGVTDHARRPKPQGLELARFAGVVRSLAADGWSRPAPEVAIVVPELFERSGPGWSPAPGAEVKDALFQAYIAAREADLPVGLLREVDLVEMLAAGQGKSSSEPQEGQGPEATGDVPWPLRARLVLMPGAKLMTGPGLQAVLGLARAGAVVYASYFAGAGPGQLGPWTPWLGAVFGVSHSLRYGLTDRIDADTVTLEMVRDFGSLSDATRLTFGVSGQGHARSHLPVDPVGAEVLAIDDFDRPALLANRAGDGWMVLCTYPLEHMAAQLPDANPEATWSLYSGLADAAGVARPVHVPDPRICVGALDVGSAGDKARRVYLALNLSDEVVAAPVVAPGLVLRLSTVSMASPTPGEDEPQGPQGQGPDLAPGGQGPGPQDQGAQASGPQEQEGTDEPMAADGLEGQAGAADLAEVVAVESAPAPPGQAPPAAVVADEVGHELLELRPYEVVLLESAAAPQPPAPGPAQDPPGPNP